MLDAVIRIEFLSDWHVGSGFGDGALADSILTRDADGLPYIPGRAVKGALREGAWRLGLCREDLELMECYIWGTASNARLSNVPGKISVSSGRLPEALASWLLERSPGERRAFVGDMTLTRAQTALDADKIVKPQSLRSMECGIPGLCFQSRLRVNAPDLPDSWLSAYFQAVCAAVKSIGGNRARGLGNCRVTLEGAAAPVIKIPGECPLSPEALRLKVKEDA